MFRKSLAAAGLTAAFLFVPVAANALDCTNASRPAYSGTEWVFVPDIGSNVHFNGNWGYVEAWGAWVFLPPGTVPGMPGSGGNFQSGEGFALLANALCDSQGAVLDKRQGDRGIQLMHGCGDH
ncbi:hypothetical protein V1638_02305 [Pseudarthrobacter sp. J64]|uniref:hypothetical protein n=1 Tax=Pseudarthrobacter sp. J64 TaxID=3116485 RepID=UPI002E80C90E|nr:hypothetical protein [Pseudarthrobacter sp. J64]MEE2568232.1 hypothetical protein [Pseudarthrobacter sp. J64]